MALSLEKLLQEKDLRSITIKDITETAGLSKNTFYNNFEDKNALLKYLFTLYGDDIKAASIEKKHYANNDNLTAFADGASHVLYEKKEKFSKILKHDVNKEFYWGVIRGFKVKIQKDFLGEFMAKANSLDPELVTDFFAGAFATAVYAVSQGFFNGTEEEFSEFIRLIWKKLL